MQPETTTGPAVFLAGSVTALDEERIRVITYLRQAGLRVLTPETLPFEREAYLKALHAALTESVVFVQLLSAEPPAPDLDDAASDISLQFETAQRLGITILQWRDPALDLSTITDEKHRATLQATSVEKMGIEEFKAFVAKRALTKPATHAPPRPVRDGSPLNGYVFLNRAIEDRDTARPIAELLSELKVDCMLPLDRGDPGEIRTDLEENLRECEALIIVYGVTSPGWVRAQLRRYPQSTTRAPPRYTGDLRGPTAGKGRSRRCSARIKSHSVPRGLRSREVDRFSIAPVSEAFAIHLTQAPYPGLRPFQTEETDIFFGRERQTDDLLRRLSQTHFLPVIGPSGCGKSSLVRAGLLASIETGFIAEAGGRWRVLAMMPRDRPIEQLANALDAAAPESPKARNSIALQAILRSGPRGLIEALKECGMVSRENVLLFVDQFEEIFRFGERRSVGDSTNGSDVHCRRRKDEADAFVTLLLETARDHAAYVVLTMRSDFLRDCSAFAGLPEAFNKSIYLTPRLDRDEIQAAIEEPARVFGGNLRPELVRELINDADNNQDQLPLMQHVLMRMWSKAASERPSEPPVLTLADYAAVGEISKALCQDAEAAFETELKPEEQKIAEVMFRALCVRGSSDRDTRAPARLDHIARVAGVKWEDVVPVVEVFRTGQPLFSHSANRKAQSGHRARHQPREPNPQLEAVAGLGRGRSAGRRGLISDWNVMRENGKQVATCSARVDWRPSTRGKSAFNRPRLGRNATAGASGSRWSS